MRSQALHAVRPMRAGAPSLIPSPYHLPAATRQSPFHQHATRAASSSSYTPRPRAAPSTTTTSTYRARTATAAATAKPATSTTSTSTSRTAAPASTSPSTPTPSSSSGPTPTLDPQAAIPQAATIDDVDPQLAAQIPMPGTGSNGYGNPSTAFTAALTRGDGNGSGPGPGQSAIDWSSSFHGLSTTAFSPETAAVLMQPLDAIDIEIKPDGIIYLPEIKYRRILNRAFGPGGWGLAPRGELVVGEKVVTREYALVVHGRFIAQARGECQYFSEETIPTAGEGCKSNALLRCCKDLGIASELWDPRFIRTFKKAHCHEIWVEHIVNKKRRQVWTRKDSDPAYPYVVAKGVARS